MANAKYEKLMAAVLIHEHKKTQEEVASILGKSQTTIGRWLKSQEVVARVKQRMEVDIALEEHESARFVAELEDYHRSTRCTVVPEGPDKNVDLIAEAAARIVLDAFKSAFDERYSSSQNLDITVCSGETVRRTMQRFVALLAKDRLLVSAIRQSEVRIRLLPAALAWAPELHALFPSAVVVNTWMQLRELLTDDRVVAFAPSIPGDWSPATPEGRGTKLDLVNQVMRDAKRAAILLCSVGTVSENTYPKTLQALGFSLEESRDIVSRFPGEVGEVVYVPFIEHESLEMPAEHLALSQVCQKVESTVVGLHLVDLVAAASNPAQTVICAAGGTRKQKAICDVALGMDPGRSIANHFIVDVGATSYWMTHKRYPKRVIGRMSDVRALRGADASEAAAGTMRSSDTQHPHATGHELANAAAKPSRR